MPETTEIDATLTADEYMIIGTAIRAHISLLKKAIRESKNADANAIRTHYVGVCESVQDKLSLDK